MLAPRGADDWIEWPPGRESWRSCRGLLQEEVLRRGHPVGLRPDRYRTVWLAIDIDHDSPYHPEQDPAAVDHLRKLLAEEGIDTILVQSSSSTGLHLWAPVPEQRTQQLARWLERLVTMAGFRVAPGVLELNPNLTRNGTVRCNAIRLPLIAPDSCVLDEDLVPVHQDLTTFCDAWEALQERNSLFDAIRRTGSDEGISPYPSATGRLAEAQQRLQEGFTGPGQTNALACDAAFVGSAEGLKGVALQRRMCKLLQGAPGFACWSRHVQEIRSGRYEGWYRHYSRKPSEYRRSFGPVHAGTEGERRRHRDPEFNTKISARQKSVLLGAIRDLQEAGKVFPHKSAAIEAVIEHLKRTTGQGMSKSTIYKRHLDLLDGLLAPS